MPDLARLYHPVRAIFVSRDGTRLMFYGTRFGVWDLTKGSLVRDRGNGYDIGIAASSDCKLVARGTGYRAEEHCPYIETAVELFDGRNGGLLSVGSHEVLPTAIAFSSDRSLAAGGEGGELRFWHWESGFLELIAESGASGMKILIEWIWETNGALTPFEMNASPLRWIATRFFRAAPSPPHPVRISTALTFF